MDQKFPLALVTGAAHRLGRAFALTLAQRGYGILLHYFGSSDLAAATASEIRALGVPVFTVQADLADETQVDKLFYMLDTILTKPDSEISGLFVLVNSAALMQVGEVGSLALADWDLTMALNLRAPFLCAQKAFLRMASGGLIVNITDVAAHKVWTRYPAYTVSKAGLETLTKILARSFAPKVRVNAIAPGLVLASDEFPAEDWARLVDRLPISRAAFLDEVTGALEFLLQNEYLTGQTITVDGGYSLL